MFFARSGLASLNCRHFHASNDFVSSVSVDALFKRHEERNLVSDLPKASQLANAGSILGETVDFLERLIVLVVCQVLVIDLL